MAEHAGVQVERALEPACGQREIVELLPDLSLDECRLRAAARVDTCG
jgi:hypothetical protein